MPDAAVLTSSKAERATAIALQALLEQAHTTTDLSACSELPELLSSLEYFLPQVLRRFTGWWANESLDGIFPIRIAATSPRSVEVYGLALLISDQSLVPMYAHLGVAEGARVADVQCMIAEWDPGDPQQLVRVPYDRLGSELRRLRARTTPIRWAFTARVGTQLFEAHLHVVSECCPVGCGCEVVILRSLTDATLFCFCDSCGCAWASPAETQFAAGLQSINSIDVFAPSGVNLPTNAQIAEQGLQSAVIGTIAVAEWGRSVDELNARISSP